MWYDLIIFGLLVICTVRGAAKGFAWQVAAIGALAICFFFAQTASLAIAPLIKLDPPLNRWVAMFILYVGASFVSFAAARGVRRTLEKWQFVEYDKHLGAIFGFAKGAAIGLVITFFAVTLSETARAAVLASYSGNAAGHVMSALHPVLPAELHGVIDPYLEKLGREVAHKNGDFGDHPDGHESPAGDDGFGLPPSLPVKPPQQAGGRPDPSSKPSDDFGASPTDFGPTPDWPDRPKPAGAPPKRATSDLERLVADIPDDLKESAIKAIRNTAPEDRDELLAKLRTAIPGLIKAVSMEWENGKPADADRRTRLDETLREIAAVYTTKIEDQQTIVRRAEEQLQGLPEGVAEVVAQDWYADLLRLSSEDPDPQTDLSTRLDVRIKRQLKSFGVNPDDLSADARSRLGSAPR